MMKTTPAKIGSPIRIAVLIVSGAALLSGCGSASGQRTLGGSMIGSAQKPNSSAPLIAALGGGVIGRSAGLAISKADRQRALEAEYRALEAAPGGQPVVWEGTGVAGSVVAAAPYQVGSQNCRQYSHTVTIKGQQTVARGAACRNADGSWTPLN
jgi:surface antigen